MAEPDTELEDSADALAASEEADTAEGTTPQKAMPAINPKVFVPKIATKQPAPGNWRTVSDSAAPDTAPVSRTGTPIDYLRPDQVVSIRARMEVQLNRQRVQGMAAMKGAMDDAMAEAVHTGAVSKPLNEDYFTHVLGPDAGRQVYQQYSEGVQGAMDSFRLSVMSPGEQASLLKKYEPVPGSPDYAVQLKRAESLQNEAAKIDQQRTQDPASFALTHTPTVREAFDTYSKAIDSGDLPTTQKAARALANQMDAAQAHYGLSPAQRKLFPKALMDQMQEKLHAANQEGGEGAYKFITGQAQIWGDNWPKIYAQAKKDAGPLFEVIGALGDNLSPRAGIALSTAANTPTNKILETIPKDQVTGLQQGVVTLMQDFNKTVYGSDREKTIQAFDDQSKKLAAIYMSQGLASSPTQAAKMAYDDIVGKHYTIQGTTRIPKNIPYDPSVIGYGATIAQGMLGKEIPVASKTDALGRGVTQQYLADATAQNLKDFGTWVTAPGDVGLALRQENGMFARGADGKPIMLTWKQLADLAGGRKIAPPDVPSSAFQWMQ